MWDSLIQWALSFLTSVGTSNPIVHLLLVILGILVVAGQAVVLATPSTADDAAWAKIKAIPILGQVLDWLANFAPWHK